MNWQPPKSDGPLPEGWESTSPDRDAAGWWHRHRGVILVGLAIAGLVAWAGLSADDGPASPSEDPWQAHAQCANFTRQRLKAPSTADFPEYDDPGVSVLLYGGSWTVRSWVDAENGFGANIRTRFTCIVSPVGDKWRLDSWTED